MVQLLQQWPASESGELLAFPQKQAQSKDRDRVSNILLKFSVWLVYYGLIIGALHGSKFEFSKGPSMTQGGRSSWNHRSRLVRLWCSRLGGRTTWAKNVDVNEQTSNPSTVKNTRLLERVAWSALSSSSITVQPTLIPMGPPPVKSKSISPAV